MFLRNDKFKDVPPQRIQAAELPEVNQICSVSRVRVLTPNNTFNQFNQALHASSQHLLHLQRSAFTRRAFQVDFNLLEFFVLPSDTEVGVCCDFCREAVATEGGKNPGKPPSKLEASNEILSAFHCIREDTLSAAGRCCSFNYTPAVN